jgi:hypothetical protein
MISTSTNSTSLNLKQMIDETEQQHLITNFTNQFSTTNTDHHHTNDIIMNGINDILGIKSLSNSSKCSSAVSSTTSSTSSLIISSSKKSSTQSLNKNDYTNFSKSSPSSIKYSNDLNCPLCKKRLQEPKLLNCLHVYCKNCLIAHYLTENSQFGIQNQQQSQLTCPKCKQSTPISDQYDIEHLQDDHVLSNMLDMAMIEEQKLDCTSCKSEEKAVARCSDCAKFLCSNCVSAHENMTCFADHFVVRFQNDDTLTNSDITPSTRQILKEPIHKPLYCKYHLKENLKFFCQTCQIPICSDCITLHQQPKHQYERIVDVETRNIIDLENLLIKAKETINLCQQDYQLVDQYLNDLQEQLETGKQMIDETFQTYRAMLEKRRNELVKEMEEKHSNKEASLIDMHTLIDTLINQLNHCVRYGERVLENGNGAEISMLKRLIITQFKYLLGCMPQMNQMDIYLKFQTDEKKFEKFVYDSFGYITNTNLKQQQHQQQNMIQSSSSTSSSSVSSQSSIPVNVTIEQISRLQKQFERLQANSNPATQIDQQQWILANLIKQQQMKQMNDHESSVPISPTSSLTDELYLERLMINKPNTIEELQQNLQRLQMQQKNFTSSAISPPLIANPTSEWPIINSNANNTRQASRCETPSSYLANALNLINGPLDGLNGLDDILQPNNLNVASVAAAVLAQQHQQQQQQQQQQNLNQLTKFMQPPELNALANLNELALTASLNGNSNGNNLQNVAFSDVQSNSSQSPPLGAIGSNINSIVANINNNNQSAFAGMFISFWLLKIILRRSFSFVKYIFRIIIYEKLS